MKRFLTRMLALTLGLCLLATSGLAAEPILNTRTEDGNAYINIRRMVTVGKYLYIFGNEGTRTQLHRWTEGQEKTECLADDLIYAEFFNSTEEIAAYLQDNGLDGDPRYALSSIFTDGENLYGVNRLEELVFTIEPTAEGLRYTEVATIPWTLTASHMTPQEIIRVGKWLLWQEWSGRSGYDKSRLLAFNLEAGTVKQAVLLGLEKTLSYKDGKALLICQPIGTKDRPADVHAEVIVYDPETDKRTILGYLPMAYNYDEIDYHPGLDMIVYQDSTRVMGWSPETGAEQIGFIPATSAVEIAAVGDSLAFWSGNEVSAQPIARGFTTEKSLTIFNANLNAATYSFNQKHPDVPFYYVDDNAADVRGYTYSDGNYAKQVERGELLDLSVYPEIKAYVDTLYPVFREAVTEGDAIYGIPVTVSGYDGWFINKAVMQELGLTAADIPTNLVDLCAFATRWNDEFAEKYPQYTLLNNTENYRDRLLQEILAHWSDLCQHSGKDLDVNEPALREALAALEAAKLDKLDENLKQTDPEKSEYKQALIWTGCKIVGNWGSYMEEYSDRIFLPLSLTANMPYTARVETFRVISVSAKTAVPDLAAELLLEHIAAQDDTYKTLVLTDCTEPIMNPDYAATLAHEEAHLASMEAQLENSVNKAAMERRIAEQKAYIETELKRFAYRITPSAIENYVDVLVPGLFIRLSNALNSSLLNPVIWDYEDGKLTLDEFLEQMDRTINEINAGEHPMLQPQATPVATMAPETNPGNG